MAYVRPKKNLGQHFLTDLSIAERTVLAMDYSGGQTKVLEIGPGTGVLSDFLVKEDIQELILLDVDKESVAYLQKKINENHVKILHDDFLQIDEEKLFGDQHYSIIGNFPYNISSQIFFRILDEKDQVDQVVCMLQKEVAERIASAPGSKIYGILSVLLQAYYDIEYLFTVEREVFNPPPKVLSAVIRLKRNNVAALDCDEKLFRRVVKEGFQKRRKTLRNALKGLNLPPDLLDDEMMGKRAEQLSIQDFINITNKIGNGKSSV